MLDADAAARDWSAAQKAAEGAYVLDASAVTRLDAAGAALLAGLPGEPEWREAMQKLIDAETGSEPKRRARMVSAYNRGYRSFASVYTTCTASAIAAEGFYRNEGATLAVEIAARYGN